MNRASESCGADRPLGVAAATSGHGRSYRSFIVEVVEAHGVSTRNGPPRRYEFERPPEFHVQCSNPGCHDGGVLIAPIVREMLANHETERLLMEMCPGRVLLSGTGTARVKCEGMFFIRLRFAYRFLK